jgi:hypothetical protein
VRYPTREGEANTRKMRKERRRRRRRTKDIRKAVHKREEEKMKNRNRPVNRRSKWRVS